MDKELREEVLYGQVFDSDGQWYCSQGAGPKSMVTSPSLRTKEQAEQWLSDAVHTAQSQWPDDVKVVLNRI